MIVIQLLLVLISIVIFVIIHEDLLLGDYEFIQTFLMFMLVCIAIFSILSGIWMLWIIKDLFFEIDNDSW